MYKSYYKRFISIVMVFHLFVGIMIMYAQEDYWNQTNGPEGGNITNIVVNHTGKLFAGTNEDELYTSANDGDFWIRMPDLPQNTFDLVCTNDGLIFAASYGGGIYKSEDNGNSWISVNEGLEGYTVNCLAINKITSKLYAGISYNGVFCSDNLGEDWYEVNSGLDNYENLRIENIYVHSNGEVYVAAWEWSIDGALFQSNENHTGWIHISSGIPNTNIRDVSLNLSNDIFVATYGGGVFRKMDGSSNWEIVDNGLGSTYFNTIHIDNFNRIHAGSFSTGLYFSSDNGDSWSEVTNGIWGKTVNTIVVKDEDPYLYFVGMEGPGIFRSQDNGTEFTAINNGIRSFVVTDMTMTPSNHLYVSSYESGVYHSPDNGETWEVNNNGLTDLYLTDIASNTSAVFVSAHSAGVHRLMSGDIWELANTGITTQIRTLFCAVNGDVFAGGSYGTIYRSQNQGGNWDLVYDGGAESIQAFTQHPDNNYLFAGFSADLGMLRSTDGGSTWAFVNNGLGTLNIRSLAVLKGSESILAATDNGLFITDDHGENWSQIDIGNTPAYIFCVTTDNADHIFLGTGNGVYWSEDQGSNWAPNFSGMSEMLIQDFAFDQQNHLYVGTYGAGVYVSVKPTTAVHTTFSVKMMYRDEFIPENHQVVVRGNFNDWLADEGLLLEPVGDELQTYAGTWTFPHPDSVNAPPVNGVLQYKFVITDGTSDIWEDRDDRQFEWDGSFDLVLPPAWFGEYNNNPDDVAALAELYNSTGGDNWSHNENWLSDHPLATWHGIVQDHGNVIYIDLMGNNLMGTLPTEIGNISQLIGLQLSQNSLTGTIPLTIGNLSNLHFLDLYSNELTGSIPTEIYDIPDLESLVLFLNNLSGTLPGEIGSLSNLRYLNLGDNNFSGPLPVQIGNLNMLNDLAIGGNNFEGNIPVSLTNLDRLKNVWLNNNDFSGLPDLSPMDSLNQLYITDNQFTFEDLEPNMDLSLEVFDYIPQDSVGMGKDTLINVGDYYELRVEVGGENNAYQWYKDQVFIPTATNAVLPITFIAGEFYGSYLCRITNTQVPGLTLISRPEVIHMGAPATPVLAAPGNGATQILPEDAIKWYQAVGADRYQLQLSFNSNFTDIQYDIGDIADTTIVVSELSLSGDALYYWRVRASNLQGSSSWSAIRHFETALIPDVPPLVTPDDYTLGMPLRPTLRWNMVGNADGYHIQIAFDDQFTNIEFEQQNITTNEITMNYDLTPNQLYFWRIRSQNGIAYSAWTDFRTFAIRPQLPDNYGVNETFNFPVNGRPSDYESWDYRIIGIPGHSNQPISEFLSGEQGKDWEVYWDNGAASNYFVKYDGSNAFNCSAGKAFWVISNGNLNIQDQVETPEFNSDNVSVSIPLHSGWNLISNPFYVDVPWAMVQSYNGDITQPIFHFNGSFDEVQVFFPAYGFYFYNQSNLPSLNIPYPPESGNKSVQAILSPMSDHEFAWAVNVELHTDYYVDRSLKIGTSADADNGLDRFDYRKPRAVGKIPSLYFTCPEWDAAYPIFACDIKAPVQDLQKWEFTVWSSDKKELRINIPGIEQIPEMYDVVLVDKTLAKFIDLRAGSSYAFIPVYSESNFEFMVGNTDEIENELAQLKPENFTLLSNYPNPFNPVTTIPLEIPAEMTVSLKVFNTLGQEINELHNGILQPGRHFFNWEGVDVNGKKVSSGVYIYMVQLNNGRAYSGKMILMK